MSRRFDLLDRLAQETFGAPPAWRFFVPGRIEVFGKHTDYAGGRSLVCATPHGFRVAAVPSDEGAVVIVDARSGERFSCVLDNLPGSASGWRAYALAVVRRLASNFPRERFAARVVFTSDLPPAAGISSSSALVVALAEALIARAGIEHTAAWRDAIRTDEDRAGYFGCIENGASFGPLAGDAGVGTHGGSEDHAAIVMSRAGELRQFSYDPLRLDRVIPMPAGWTFAVAFSGVHAAKGAERQADYNRLALACQAIVEAWRARHPGDRRTLGGLVRDGCLPELTRLVAKGAPLPPTPGEAVAQGVSAAPTSREAAAQGFSPALAARLEHFAAEDARVAEAADAFEQGDIASIGVLAEGSHAAAGRLLGNQVLETNALAMLGLETGAAAASAFGGGWGGSVWALIRAAEADMFLERWLGAYRAMYPHHRATGFISPPSDGVVRG